MIEYVFDGKTTNEIDRLVSAIWIAVEMVKWIADAAALSAVEVAANIGRMAEKGEMP